MTNALQTLGKPQSHPANSHHDIHDLEDITSLYSSVLEKSQTAGLVDQMYETLNLGRTWDNPVR